MNLIRMHYAIILAKEKNFTSAANSLYISQPTLSQQIKKLEKDLGTSLFKRTNKGVLLTEAGEEFILHATHITNDLKNMTSSMEKYKYENKDIIKVGLLWSFGYLKVNKYFKIIKNSYPNLIFKFNINCSQILLDKLLDEELDCILINSNEKELSKYNVNYYKISESIMCALINKNNNIKYHQYITPNELKNQTILLPESGSDIYSSIINSFNIYNIQPIISGTSKQIDVCIQFVKANLGISFVSEEIASYYNHLPIIPVPFMPQITRSTYLVITKNNQNIDTTDLFYILENMQQL